MYTLEDNHIKVQDISLTITHRIHRGIAKAQLIEMMMEDPKKYETDLHNYATLMYNFLCTVPDATFYDDINNAVLACINRHKDVYGIKEEISPDEDAKILQEEKELHEAVEEIADKTKEDADSATPETSKPETPAE
ncbi:MAG: hypothetical protein ACI3ZT_00890 [Candidatus Cryptobacteroides sp.]